MLSDKRLNLSGEWQAVPCAPNCLHHIEAKIDQNMCQTQINTGFKVNFTYFWLFFDFFLAAGSRARGSLSSAIWCRKFRHCSRPEAVIHIFLFIFFAFYPLLACVQILQFTQLTNPDKISSHNFFVCLIPPVTSALSPRAKPCLHIFKSRWLYLCREHYSTVQWTSTQRLKHCIVRHCTVHCAL